MIPQETIDRVLSHIDGEELIRMTAALVRVNSVWDPENGTCEEPAARLQAEWAEAHGFETTWEEVAPGRPNVIVNWPAGSGQRRLMFEGHTDVVTAGDLNRWTRDPFGAEIEGRRMYGRGTNDTKGNGCAMLMAMHALKASGVKLAGSIVAGVLCDEEGGMIGVHDFIARGHADDVTAAIICEPEDGIICTSQKGAVRARYTVKGRMSHGAMPLSGLPTAPALARLIDGLAELESRAVEELGPHEHLGWPSFTPTVIQAPASGPPQLNVVPGEAEILVDVRTVPGQDHDRIKADLTDLAARTAAQVNDYYQAYDARRSHQREHNLTIEVEFITDRPCTLTEPDEPIISAVDWATRAVWDIEPEYGGVPGATDGTYLWSDKNIPIVTIGAGDRYVPHQADEWVDLDQLIDTAKIYALAALHYLWPGEGA